MRQCVAYGNSPPKPVFDAIEAREKAGTPGAEHKLATYDQTIDVFPRAGNLLTVAGAIAGGPVGAAIGAAANAVLNKPLGQLAAKSYRVTGPWKDPKVETISRGDAAAVTKEPPG